jgi:hypothetical protein
MFGPGLSVANGWRLKAQVKPVAGTTHLVTPTLETNVSVRLPQQVVLLLHPTYAQRALKVTVDKSLTEMNFLADGAYTAVAIADGGRTILTYDLASTPGATPEFTSS